MRTRSYSLLYNILVFCLILIGLLGLPGCGGDGDGLNADGALFILAEVDKGIESYTPPSDVTSAAFVATSMDVMSNSVTNATVTINGTSASYIMFGYMTQGAPSINVDEDVEIIVDRGENAITATLPMPEKPVITTPADNSWHDSNSTINVQWNTLSTTPDMIIFEIKEFYTVSGDDYTTELAGTATSHSIPAGTLLSGISGIEINVYSVNLTTNFTGSVIVGSFYTVSHLGQIEINTNP
jgi:hypothetical protein